MDNKHGKIGTIEFETDFLSLCDKEHVNEFLHAMYLQVLRGAIVDIYERMPLSTADDMALWLLARLNVNGMLEMDEEKELRSFRRRVQHATINKLKERGLIDEE